MPEDVMQDVTAQIKREPGRRGRPDSLMRRKEFTFLYYDKHLSQFCEGICHFKLSVSNMDLHLPLGQPTSSQTVPNLIFLDRSLSMLIIPPILPKRRLF
jgi:hypothetical protein